MLEVENVAQLCNGQESESACQYEDAGGDVHDGVVLETFKRVGEQCKTYAAEGTHGLECRAENAVVHIHGLELREVDYAADEFKDKREWDHGSEDAACIDVSFLRELGEEYGLVAKAGVHAGKQDECRRCGHDAKPAKLHQDDDEPVPNICVCRRNIDDGKPGDADSRHGREECFDEAYWALPSLRQAQKCGADSNEQKIGEYHQHDGVCLGLCLENVLGERVREHLVL